ncbi:hypothetical protein CU048_04585 [Beijerinckiaceae bacterium]|nr:hypothetical protein CU048_04585 [Beijerinckiaceae bacterium]
MKRAKLENMSVDQLVGRYAEVGVALEKAELMGEIGRVNRLFGQIIALERELRARGCDARLALFALYDHPSPQVRLNAAKATLGVASDAAKRVIQDIYDTESGPQALDGGMTLRFLENGVFKPD